MTYVTIRDVAQKAGTSVSTVSRALNDNGRISPSTKRTVQQVVAELGYIPDFRARTMRSLRTYSIGLLVPDIRNGYFADLAYTIQDELFQSGYNTFIGTSSESLQRQDAFITSILAQRIDGAIVVPQGEQSKALRLLIDRRLPLIFVDRQIQGMAKVPVVDSDPVPGIRAALTDIHRHGFTKVGYISGPVLDSPTLQDRELAFRSIAASIFGEECSFVESSSFDQSSCLSVLRRMRDSNVRAMIYGYSPDALQAIATLSQYKIQPGNQISMVSFDDLDAFRLVSPQISVISQQVNEIGKRGAQLILKMIEDKAAPMQSQRVETIYLPRGSVGKA